MKQISFTGWLYNSRRSHFYNWASSLNWNWPVMFTKRKSKHCKTHRLIVALKGKFHEKTRPLFVISNAYSKLIYLIVVDRKTTLYSLYQGVCHILRLSTVSFLRYHVYTHRIDCIGYWPAEKQHDYAEDSDCKGFFSKTKNIY